MPTTDLSANDRSTIDMDPKQFQALGHHLVDIITGYLETIRDRPVAPDVSPHEIRSLLKDFQLRNEPREAKELLDQVSRLLFRNVRIEGHPRSWGYVSCAAGPIGALADLLASAVNPNVVAWNAAPIAVEMELQVIRWVAELLGYPRDTGGLMVSGGNMANFVALLAARRAKVPSDVRGKGMVATGTQIPRVYATDETHTWLQKAADMYGLGTESVRTIKTDRLGRINVAELETQIQTDRDSGDLPFLIIATVGTVSTGAVDPLPELAKIARRYDIWLHVDGAYGALAVVSDRAPDELKALREADSIAVDAHKWLFSPYEAGIVLVRNQDDLRAAFSYTPPYYAHYQHPGEAPIDFYEYGPQNSRAFRALKVWMVLQTMGREDFARQVTQNIEQARELFHRLQQDAQFEVFTQSLSVTTFRFVPEHVDTESDAGNEYLDRLNTSLLERIQKSGELYLSNAVIDGKFVLRACITNYRTTADDIELAPKIIARLGREVHETLEAGDRQA